MVAGRKVTPADEAATARLKFYWAHGEGAAKIAWNTPGDYDRCIVELSKYVSPTVVHGLCQNLHEEATGFPAGHAPGDKA